MSKTGNFAEQAIAKHGVNIGDAIIISTVKREESETTIGINENGRPSQTIVMV